MTIALLSLRYSASEHDSSMLLLGCEGANPFWCGGLKSGNGWENRKVDFIEGLGKTAFSINNPQHPPCRFFVKKLKVAENWNSLVRLRLFDSSMWTHHDVWCEAHPWLYSHHQITGNLVGFISNSYESFLKPRVSRVINQMIFVVELSYPRTKRSRSVDHWSTLND